MSGPWAVSKGEVWAGRDIPGKGVKERPSVTVEIDFKKSKLELCGPSQALQAPPPPVALIRERFWRK